MWHDVLIFARLMVTDGLLWQVVVVAIALVLALKDIRPKYAREVLIGLAHAASLSVVLFALYAFFGGLCMHYRFSNPAILQALSLTACSAAYAAVFCKYDWKVRLLVCSELVASSVTLTEAGGALGRVLNILGEAVWVVRLLCYAVIIILAILIRRFHINKFIEMPTRSVVLTFAVNVICFAIVLTGLIFDGLSYHFPGYVTAAHLLLYAIEILSYFTLYSVCREREDRIQLQAESELASANSEMIGLSEKTLSDMRQIRHDLKNQLAYLKILFENNDSEAVERFFADIDAELQSAVAYIDCGNKIISAILNMKKAKAEKSGYLFRTDIVVPNELPFPDTDVCSILANLLDNAIEAMENYKIKSGYIDISAKVGGDYLYIAVTNPVPREAEENKENILRLLTTKNDKNLHGMGTKIVKRLAAKYNGAAIFEIENGKFEAEIMLDLTSAFPDKTHGGGVIK